jgi:hypothetical protein
MNINYCPNCGTSIQGTLRFCYKCGADFAEFNSKETIDFQGQNIKKDLKGFIEKFIEQNTDVFKELAAKVEKGERFEKGMFFAVEMKGDKPIIKSGDIRDLKDMLKKTSFQSSLRKIVGEREGFVEFIEVKPKVDDLDKGQRITIKFPGVDSTRDIVLNQTSNGLEIIGKSNNRVYFSKINVKENFKILDKNIQNGIFTIKIK